MTGQLEFSLRATLCRKLAKREPANRVLWMAEAETWSRLSKERSRGAAEEMRDLCCQPDRTLPNYSGG